MKHLLFFSWLLLLYFHASAQTFTDVSSQISVNLSSGFSLYGNSVSFVDFNGDGLDDLTFGTTSGQPIQFYINTGSGFSYTPLAIPPLFCDSKHVIWVDFDNDGDKDLFATCNLEPNRIYRNDGNLSFTDITPTSGLTMENDPTFGATFGDYDNDGWLDLYLVNLTYGGSVTSYCNHLYRNDQSGGFSDVTWTTNTPDSLKAPFCAAFLDFDKDGNQDIYISQDRYVYDNTMLKNMGNGIFQDESVSTGTNIFVSAMNVGVGDYDNDADLDIYITNENVPPYNLLLTNNGNSTFSNTAVSAGVELQSDSWAGNFSDFDNDTHLDLYVSSVNAANQDAVFMNNGNLTFNELNFPNSPEGSYSNAIGDFNNDGLTDVIVTGYGLSQHRLWENTSNSGNNWIKVKLEGTTSNRDGVGSWIETYIGGNKYVRYTHCGEGYLNQNSFTQTIGLGAATTIDTLKVIWLSGIVDTYYDVLSNQTFPIQEGNTSIALPIELIEFKARPADMAINLTWKTEHEVNFSHYDLERSEDGALFSTIQRIEGTGSIGNESSEYGFKDETVFHGKVYYYRLKIVDSDEAFSFSEIISSQYSKDESNHFEILPNPLNVQSSRISILSNSDLLTDIEIYSTNGNLILIFNDIDLKTGINDLPLPNKFSPGVYMVFLMLPNRPPITRRLIVLN